MRLIGLASIVFLASCTTTETGIPAGFTQRIVTFEKRPYVLSPAGHIILHVPQKYDTLLTWLDASDNQMSHKPKYRFVNSKGCLLQESGFFKMEGSYCTDTLDRLTIETQMTYWPTETLAIVDKRIKSWDTRNNAFGIKATVWKSKKLELINGRQFSIVESFGSGKLINDSYEQITAVTNLYQGKRCWEIKFQFDCRKKETCENFAGNAYATMRSVRIDTLSSQ